MQVDPTIPLALLRAGTTRRRFITTKFKNCFVATHISCDPKGLKYYSINTSHAGYCCSLLSAVLATPGFNDRHHDANHFADSLERTVS